MLNPTPEHPPLKKDSSGSSMSTPSTNATNAAFTAYLKPLLHKHTDGQLLTYDDLIQAWNVASAGIVDVSVQKQLQALHDSQLQAYSQVAQAALQDYAQTIKLAQVEATDTEQLYVDKCLAALQIPEWNIPDANQLVTTIVQKRAIQAWQNQSTEGADDLVEEDDEEEQGDEEDTMDSTAEEATDVNGSGTTNQTKPKRKNLLGLKQARKKVTVSKATTKGAAVTIQKGAIRGGRKPGLRGRRGGRGGAAPKT